MLRDKKHIVLWWLLPMACIWIAVFSVGTIALYLPGVYFDAVYPDYLAAIGAFPGVDNFTQITKHVGLPLLGNYYHGTMTAGFQYIILKCFGYANQYTLRIPNLIYFAAIGSLIYIICCRISKASIVPLIGTLLCVTASNVLSFPRTQYYIMLPGCIFFLYSFFLLYTNIDKADGFRSKVLLMAGVFQGLAFYGYFTYLFFSPASIILIAVFSKGKLPQKIRDEIIYVWGIIIGSIGYFIGYYDSFLTNVFGKVPLAYIALGSGTLCALIYLIIPVYLFWRHSYDALNTKSMKVFIAVSVVALVTACVIGGIVLFVYKDKFQGMLNLLNVTQERNAENRLFIFWQMMYMLISNRSAQGVIFGEVLNGAFGIYIYLGVVMTVVTIVVAVLYKKNKDEQDILLKHIGAGYLYLIVYYLFTLPISDGMQPQHFVVTYFLLFILMILDAVYIGRHMPNWVKISTGLVVLVMGVYFNVTNDMLFIKMLNQTEGRNKYSSVLDEFAKEAYLDEEKENKIYVFPQWGFHANFIYLTANTCMTVRDADIEYEMLQEKLDEGYTLVIAAFDKQEIREIIDNLKIEFCKSQDMKSKEGDYVFTYTTLK